MGTFEEYLQRFCDIHNIPKEQAARLAIVREIEQYYKDEGKPVKEDTKNGH